jgi:hypothetical protein
MATGKVTMVITGRYELDCGHAHYQNEHCAHMQCWNYASKCGLHGIVKTSDLCNRTHVVPVENDDIMVLKHVIEGAPKDLPQGEYTVVFDRMEGDTAYYKMKEVDSEDQDH